MSTWSKARETFGQGTPQTGESFDQSGSLRQMQTTVESAAPGSRWTGTAASAYDTANTNHGKVFGELASLDQRLSAKVTESAQVVSTGRQNLDTVRQWVLDAAASVPAGKTREQMLMPIVKNGLGQVTEIITTSNAELNRIGGAIKGIGGEYQALNDQKFAPREGEGDVQGVLGEDDKDLRPEDMEELARKTLAGDQEAAAKVDEILNGIDNDQLGPNSTAHPLDPVQAELVGQMQAQMSDMSMNDVNAARERLGENKDVLTNAMQVMSNPNVEYPRHDGDGPQVVPSTPGGPLPNDGVLPGDTGALPRGVQDTLNMRSDFDGPPDPRPGYPGSGPVDWEGAERTRAADGMKNLADIVGDGDPRFQQGTALDREMMSNAKDWLASQESPDGRSQEHWGDEVVERVFDTAGRDTVVNHDMFTSDKDFMQDVLTHEWQDNGQSASTLTDWISRDAYSLDPAVNERAGQTASAIADYLGDPANKDILMNNSTGSQPNMSLGQMNPELTQSLAQSMSPYVDEMAGRDLDGSSGWKSIDGDSDLSYPHATNVFGVLGTDSDAARILDTRSASVQGAFINEYANSVIESNGQSGDSAAIEAAGRLKGITDQGAFMAVSDVESDASKTREIAYNRMVSNYDLVKDIAGTVPFAGDALTIQSALMKEAILGPPPGSYEPGQAPIESSLVMKSALASAFMEHSLGDPAQIEQMKDYLHGDAQLDVPTDNVYDRRRADYQRYLDGYFNGIGSAVTGPLTKYEDAYRDALR
ncbi:EspA/EspE family type VII secretion system effector [Mycolicibacterium sp. 624]|uniref:TPR repeat region-containing protein n=1 Tax=Mycolicibacterium sp. 624 TaxID=3156314 RepID=UPI003390E54D